MIYGYARVSTKEQKLDRQIEDIKKFGVDKIYCDKQSGKDFNRFNYKILRKKIKKNDLLVIKSIDRLGRNYDMIINEWSYITKDIQADIVVLDMPLLDTRIKNENLTGKFITDIVLQLLSYVAETERINIKKRQKEGIKIAKEKGVIFGRPKIKNTPEQIELFQKCLNKEITITDAIRKSHMSCGSFYKYYNLYRLGI